MKTFMGEDFLLENETAKNFLTGMQKICRFTIIIATCRQRRLRRIKNTKTLPKILTPIQHFRTLTTSGSALRIFAFHTTTRCIYKRFNHRSGKLPIFIPRVFYCSVVQIRNTSYFQA